MFVVKVIGRQRKDFELDANDEVQQVVKTGLLELRAMDERSAKIDSPRELLPELKDAPDAMVELSDGREMTLADWLRGCGVTLPPSEASSH